MWGRVTRLDGIRFEGRDEDELYRDGLYTRELANPMDELYYNDQSRDDCECSRDPFRLWRRRDL